MIADELKKERRIRRGAFRTDALDPILLGAVDFRGTERRVVKENLDAVCALLLEPLHGIAIQQVRKPAPNRLVVTGLLIGKQQSCIFRALRGSREAKFGIKQNSAGVGCKNPADGLLEADH